MAEIDDHAKETLSEVRKVGANYEEHQQEVGLDIPVDLVHFKKFPVVDSPGKYMKVGHDTRSDISPDDSPELPDYSGPFNGNLRFSDFSKDALINMLEIGRPSSSSHAPIVRLSSCARVTPASSSARRAVE